MFPRLIRPYVDPILKVLIPKLRGTDQNPMVVASVLRAIGDLAPVRLKILLINFCVLRRNLKNLSRGSNMRRSSNMVVPREIVFSVSRFKPALN